MAITATAREQQRRRRHGGNRDGRVTAWRPWRKQRQSRSDGATTLRRRRQRSSGVGCGSDGAAEADGRAAAR